VYTIAYHVPVHVHVYTRASLTDILARKSARVGGQVGELNGPHCRAHRTRRLPREDPRAEVGEEVLVGVGPVKFKLYARMRLLHVVTNERIY